MGGLAAALAWPWPARAASAERTLILIPCCIRKRPGGEANLPRNPASSALQGLSAVGSERLLEARRTVAEHFGCHLDAEPLLPACTRFDGNLYRKIDRGTWDRLRNCRNTEVLIVSALYGLLSPWEPACHYGFTMEDLFAPRMRLGRWWSQRGLEALLAEYIERSKAGAVHSFLSGSYVAAVSGGVDFEQHKYPGLGSGSDYYRGVDVQKMIAEHCT